MSDEIIEQTLTGKFIKPFMTTRIEGKPLVIVLDNPCKGHHYAALAEKLDGWSEYVQRRPNGFTYGETITITRFRVYREGIQALEVK